MQIKSTNKKALNLFIFSYLVLKKVNTVFQTSGGKRTLNANGVANGTFQQPEILQFDKQPDINVVIKIDIMTI